MSDLAPIVDFVEHFQRRVLVDALNEATAVYWRGRAKVFEDARPRPGEFFGRATRDEICQRDQRLAQLAANCRLRAELALTEGVRATEIPPIVWCDTCGTCTSPWSCSCGATRVGEAE